MNDHTNHYVSLFEGQFSKKQKVLMVDYHKKDFVVCDKAPYFSEVLGFSPSSLLVIRP